MRRHWKVKRIVPAAEQLWIAFPVSNGFMPLVPPSGFGRREVVAPPGSMVTATWREAMDYALKGEIPRPIAEVYPEFCGMT